MGRIKTYRRSEVLSTVMQTFWEKGYSGTSIRALVTATGVAPKSLYAEFGDKQHLFLAALEAYIEEAFSYYEDLAAGPFGLEQIRNHYSRNRFDEHFKGCLLINSIADDANIPPLSHVQISTFFRRIQSLYERHLKAAQDEGVLSAHASTGTLSEALLVFDQGLAIAGKIETQRPHLHAAIHVFLDSLFSEKKLT